MTPSATILYIEDDEASRSLVQRLLRAAGYEVLIAGRALDGIDLARRHPPHLILTDINLPDLSGRELAVRLRTEPALAGVPIVALTAQSHAFERHMTLAAGVSGYITKPLDVAAFPSQIAAYLAGRTEALDEAAREPAQRAYNQELVERLEAQVRELEAHNRDLRRLDRIKDDFIQLTAHELRTPLTTVYGYSRLAQSSPAIERVVAEDAEVRALLTGLIDSVERLHAVVNEIITVARLASGRVDLKISPLDLAQIMGRVVADYRPAADQRRLTVSFDPDQWPRRMEGDAALLELALSNLLGNAIKYTPDGGHITLRAEYPQPGRVRLSVQDSGIGIDPDEQRFIFDRFYVAGDTQLHSTSKTAFRGGGLGLGLAICRGVVEAHGGAIWVHSPGCDPARLPGSTFYVELPLRREQRSP